MSKIIQTSAIPAKGIFTRVVQPPILISDQDIQQLITFKALGKKDDPERKLGLHGPYEQITIAKTGKLPTVYFDEGDPVPWGLSIQESRSSIMWQVTSGLMDSFPEFGAVYMALALDHGLGEKEYGLELGKLNKDWNNYIDHSGLMRDHVHRSMGHTYRSVACPACSVLTTMASQNEGMISLFKEMTGLKPAQRTEFLNSKGLTPYLNMMIPTANPSSP